MKSLETSLLLLLLTLAFGVVSGPFLLSQADSWDMVGHLAHASLQREMLPQLVFWNPYFYSGYEQFTAYPPLLSLLVAVLSYPLGLVTAFKLVTVLAWVALPAALYYLYRSILNSRRALIGTAITSLILVVLPQQIGGTFFSTFVVGNVANTLGLVLFALCLGSILRDDLRRAIPLLALLVITHMIAAVVLSLFIGAKLLRERQGWTLLLGYGMAAFWLIPSLLDTFRDISTHDDYPLTVFEYAVYLFLLIGYLSYRRRSPDRRVDSLVLALGLLFFLVGVLRHLSLELWQTVPMHFHRVKIYSIVVVVPVLLRMIPGPKNNKWVAPEKSMLLRATGVLVSVVIVVAAFGKPHVLAPPYEPPELTVDGDRVLTVEGIPDVPHWHNLRHHLAAQGHAVSKGLFIEASPDAPFLLTLEQFLDREHRVPLRWGIDWSSAILADPDIEERVPFLLDIFGIQSIVTNSSLVDADVGVPGASSGEYKVIERRDQALVSLAEYPIKFSGGPLGDRDWRTLTRQWFHEGAELLVVDSAPFDISKHGSVDLISSENHFNTLVVSIDATQPIPVFIRMGYSDKWHAFSGGRELPVYRVTPNNMLIMAQEDFELQFEPLNGFNWVGLIVSILSVIGYGVVVRSDPD